MENLLPIFFIIIVCLVLYQIYKHALISKRRKRIDTYPFPDRIAAKVIDKYPHLSKPQAMEVISGLREYFHLCNMAGNNMVSMPSQAVDVAWHEFILFTRHYEYFCKKALGRFLHHTPAEAMRSPTIAEEGIKTAWKISCVRESIEPKAPDKLPILFAMDAKLAIPDGFKYDLDCKKAGSHAYCASHIGCGSCGGSSCSGGDSSGCGGD